VDNVRNITVDPIKLGYNTKYLTQLPEFSALHSFFGHESDPKYFSVDFGPYTVPNEATFLVTTTIQQI